MKLFLFLLLLLAPPPPTIPTEANNNNSQVDDKNQDQDKIKALPNEEPPSLAGLFTGFIDSLLEPERNNNNEDHEEDHQGSVSKHPNKSQNETDGLSDGVSSPEDDEDEESSTSAESSAEQDNKRQNNNHEQSGEAVGSKEGLNSASNIKKKTGPASDPVCPGACVLPTLVGNCEAVLRTPRICSNDMVCCVSKEKNKDHPDLVEFERKPVKPCAGECRNALFGLFLCADVDEEATCPESHQSCCLNRPKSPPDSSQRFPSTPPPESSEEEDIKQPPPPPSYEPQPQTTQRTPQITNPNPFQRPPPPPHSYPPDDRYRQPPPMPCPAYCLPRYFIQSCKRLLPSPCGLNAFCCAHDIRPIITTTTPEPEQSEEEFVEDEPPAKPKVNRAPCPGSCLSELLHFTCFLNAEMTDAFACSGPKMKCCAPKTTLNITTTTTVKPSTIVPLRPIYPPHPVGGIPPHPQMPPMMPPLLGNSNNSRGDIPHLQRPEFIPQRPPISSYVCGMKGPPSPGRRKRVVGGRDSSPGEWCWQVALINSLNQYLCGGALIGTEFVLTAAHCVTNIVRSGDAIYVRVGDHDLTSKYGSPGAQTLRVATTYIHHNHNSQTLDNDIALLKLQGNVALKQGVCLVCLPNKTGMELPGKRCVVTGYGYMGESGPIPLRVREAELPIVGESECIDKVNAVTEKRFVLPASSFCAGGEFKNDACQGDGGGPLVCKVHDGMYELTGLVSWGFGCGRQDVPGVYVKVSSFIGWINQIISINGGGVA